MDKLNIPEEAKAENVISFKDFQKVKMVVGEIVQAEKVDKSEKLLKLQVNIGSETRQIVSGIAKFYTSEELLGKKVVVVTNLKSAKLMGIESQGMILAAGDDTLELLFVTDQKPGSIVC
jgi:methionyl-tRNA synthetase